MRLPNVVALDTETCLIEPGRLAPPLVCLSIADAPDSYELYHHTEAREVVEALLESDALLVGDNVAYDFSVICAKWPDLLPVVFDVYAADRVSDTEIREKLHHIAVGIYRGFTRVDGKVEKVNYSLADLARRHLGLEMEKGTWQLRFGELMDVPLSDWPEEARQYALLDAVATLEVWKSQEQDARYLEDEHRQSRAAWWLQLMSCWGMITDPEGVREFARKTQQKYDDIAGDLRAAGLLRGDGSRNTKLVQWRVVAAYKSRALANLGDWKKGKVSEGDWKKGKISEDLIERTPKGKPKTDADVCERSGDPLLQRYSDFSSLKKTLSTDIPLLKQGTSTPLKVRYESLLATGRTASTPNVQNLPTEIGVRECFRPRPGHVYAVSDYSQFELRTWAQVCLSCLGYSRMAEVLNAGVDPHLQLASLILNISYDEARADYKRDPHGRVYYPRQASKSANFGFPGGLGIARFRDYARKNYGVELTEEKAAELKQFWLDAWPEASLYFNWINDVIENAAPPSIKQLFSNRVRGRVSFTEAANGMFQSLAADAAKAAGFLIARACYVEEDSPLFGCRPVNFVHDEFVVEVLDDECAHDAAVELARLMVVGAEPFLPDVPPVAEPLLCRKWSKASKPVRKGDRLVPWDFDLSEAAA